MSIIRTIIQHKQLFLSHVSARGKNVIVLRTSNIWSVLMCANGRTILTDQIKRKVLLRKLLFETAEHAVKYNILKQKRPKNTHTKTQHLNKISIKTSKDVNILPR